MCVCVCVMEKERKAGREKTPTGRTKVILKVIANVRGR